MSDKPWPTELRLTPDKRTLKVTFDNGRSFDIAAELMRVMSPSAEVQGHGACQRVTVPGKRLVGISAIDSVGTYAVRLRFDDGHDTGIFTWDYLYKLGTDGAAMMATYEAELAEAGLSRDPRR